MAEAEAPSGAPGGDRRRNVPSHPGGNAARERPKRHLGAWIAGLTSGAVFLTSGLLYGGYTTFDANLERVTIASGEAVALASGTRPALNVLLVGVDDRSTLSDEQLASLATEDVGTALTDTIILAHIPAKTDARASDQVVLVSFPRDAWVSIPGQGEGKINSAYYEAGGGEAGAQALVATVESLSGFAVDHYVEVDLNGFLEISDAIGGVEVCLNEAVEDPYTQLVLPAGPQVLSGEDALRFVRQRHGLPRGDLDRITRQQAFLAAALREVTSAGTLLNPLRVNALLEATTEAVVVDDGLTVDRMRDLAFSLKNIASGNVEFRTVPVAGLGAVGNVSVVRLDDEAMPGFFESIAQLSEPKEPPPDRPAPGEPVLTVPPRDISVNVLNGTGVSGQASAVQQALRSKGYSSPGVAANAERQDYETSVVVYGPGQEEAARTLATTVPDAEIRYDESLDSSVTLIVGLDYDGVRAIRVPGDTPPAPAAPTAEPGYDSRFGDDVSCVN